MADHVLTSA